VLGQGYNPNRFNEILAGLAAFGACFSPSAKVRGDMADKLTEMARPLTPAVDWVQAAMKAVYEGNVIQCFRCSHCNESLEVTFKHKTAETKVVQCPFCKKDNYLCYVDGTLLPPA